MAEPTLLPAVVLHPSDVICVQALEAELAEFRVYDCYTDPEQPVQVFGKTIYLKRSTDAHGIVEMIAAMSGLNSSLLTRDHPEYQRHTGADYCYLLGMAVTTE